MFGQLLCRASHGGKRGGTTTYSQTPGNLLSETAIAQNKKQQYVLSEPPSRLLVRRGPRALEVGYVRMNDLDWKYENVVRNSFFYYLPCCAQVRRGRARPFPNWIDQVKQLSPHPHAVCSGILLVTLGR